MIKHLICLFLLFAISCTAVAQQLDLCPGHLATIEADGTVSHGSKEALLKIVRSGIPIRVGWSLDFNKDGKPELAHWADAMFLSEFEGHVYAQINEIQRQTPKRGKERIDLGEKSQKWTGLIGTNGILAGRFDDDQPATEFRTQSQWCIDSRVPRSEWPTLKTSSGDNSSCLTNCNPQWRLAYHHETGGKAISGSKDQLFEAVRRGYPIRFAWGSTAQKEETKISVEHAAAPVFLTIMNGSELVVQLPEHIGQTSYWNAADAKFDQPQVMWRGLMGTTGEFDAVFVDRASGKTIQRIPQRARIAWYVFSPDPICESAAAPILAVPGGVVLNR
jgi:hypothetical protein